MAVEKYKVVMIFHEVEGVFEINGTVEFEMELFGSEVLLMDVEVSQTTTENFIRQAAHNYVQKSDFGRGSMDFEIVSIIKIENVDLEILKNALASIEECYKCGCEKPQNDLSFVDDQYYCENCL